MFNAEVSIADALLIEDLIEKHPVLRRIFEDEKNEAYHTGYDDALAELQNTREMSSAKRPAT